MLVHIVQLQVAFAFDGDGFAVVDHHQVDFDAFFATLHADVLLHLVDLDAPLFEQAHGGRPHRVLDEVAKPVAQPADAGRHFLDLAVGFLEFSVGFLEIPGGFLEQP